MNTLENLKCREREVTFYHNQIIVWWIIIFQGTLGQHCQYSGSKCSCDRWAISPTHHSFLMCFPWEILRNIEIFAYNLSVTGWVLVLVLLILPFNIWQLSDKYLIFQIQFFSYWVSVGTGANYPAMELIGPLLPEVVNIECLPHSYIVEIDTHITCLYEL